MSSIFLIDHNTFGARVASAAPGLVEIHRLSEISRSIAGRPPELQVPPSSASHRDLLGIMKPQILELLASSQEVLVQRLSELKSFATGPERMRGAIITDPRGRTLRDLLNQKEIDRIRAESYQTEKDSATPA